VGSRGLLRRLRPVPPELSLTIRHWRATDPMIGWRPGKELMPLMKLRRTAREGVIGVDVAQPIDFGAKGAIIG